MERNNPNLLDRERVATDGSTGFDMSKKWDVEILGIGWTVLFSRIIAKTSFCSDIYRIGLKVELKEVYNFASTFLFR